MPKSEQNLSKMEFWKIACALEKELTFILMKDFGIKPRAREPNFFSKVYNMKAEDAIIFNGLCEQYGITRVTEDLSYKVRSAVSSDIAQLCKARVPKI